MTGRPQSDEAPVIRWCWCGAAVAGITVPEARRFAREHCDGPTKHDRACRCSSCCSDAFYEQEMQR